MKLFITSDQHYDHAAIIGHSSRPFDSVEEMNEAMIARHNAVVGHADTVLHLGDFSLHPRGVKAILARLNGRHSLLSGNHDRCHPCHKKSARERRRYVEEYGFAFVYEGTTFQLDIEGVGRVLLSHMPFQSQNLAERYREHRITEAQFAGFTALLHGHVHEAWKMREHPLGRMLNVGVDVWNYTPISMEQICAALRAPPSESLS